MSRRFSTSLGVQHMSFDRSFRISTPNIFGPLRLSKREPTQFYIFWIRRFIASSDVQHIGLIVLFQLVRRISFDFRSQAGGSPRSTDVGDWLGSAESAPSREGVWIQQFTALWGMQCISMLHMLHMSLNPALRASSDGQHMSFDRSFRISLPAEQGARRLISYPCQRSYGNQLEENWDANSCTCTSCFWMATGLSRKPSRRKHEFSFHLISSSLRGVSKCV